MAKKKSDRPILALCLAAALWPAVSTGRAEPLRLLQAGRAAL